jgi:hypothetical protein
MHLTMHGFITVKAESVNNPVDFMNDKPCLEFEESGNLISSMRDSNGTPINGQLSDTHDCI